MKVRCKYNLLRRMTDPKDINKSKYMLYVNINDIPDNIPMQTNPRKQSLKSNVAKNITESIIDPNQQYLHALNRGITISATNIKNYTGKQEIEMEFLDEAVHGNIDGGHTYKLILKNRDKISKVQYIQLEILEGYEDIFVQIAAARNTSVQVEEKSIMNLKDQFEPIKKLIEYTPLYDNVSYIQNDKKHVDVHDIIGLIYMFDIIKFNDEISVIEGPCKATCNKKAMMDYYKDVIRNESNILNAMEDVFPDIIKLANKIELEYSEAYKETVLTKKAYFGRVAGVKSVSRESKKYYAKFNPNSRIDYVIAKGLLYPVISAFRYLLEIDYTTNKLKWKCDPFKATESLLPQLVAKTVHRIRSNNKTAYQLGIDKDLWVGLYNHVKMFYELSVAANN